MSASPAVFTCPFCGIASNNDNDARWRFCGACGVFVDDRGSYDVAKARAAEAVITTARKLNRAIGLTTSTSMTAQRRAVERLERILAFGE